ncbi:MAG: hypothetical protein JNK48_31660 [Bryobacterales bacterium]|nr:hypothetical protein [Bryobacterales bacterium]
MTCGLIALLVLATPVLGAAPQFEPNRGQSAAPSAFLARIGTAQAHIDADRIRFIPPSQAPIELHLRGMRPSQWRAQQPTRDVIRYCNLNSPALCQTGIPTYARLEQKSIYPGIDWQLHTRGANLEYDFLVHPNADPTQIRLHIAGADARLHPNGTLTAGPIVQWKPAAYQTIAGSHRPVAVQLSEAAPNEFVFQLGPYDASVPLIIDPVIESARLDATPEEDQLHGVIGAFRYGTTRSGHWSRSPNRRDRDVFVKYSAFDSSTTTLYWGGTGDEEVGGADQDSNNQRLYLAGWTNSTDAPLFSESRVPHRSYGGGSTDGFLLFFSAGNLTMASYIGGPGDDRIYDVRRTLPSGAETLPVLIAGQTTAADWPNSTIERIGPGGKTDAFAGTLQSDRQSFLVIGGSGDDRAIRLRPIDTTQWAVGGETDSPDFPTTSGSPPPAQRDLWVARTNFVPLQAPLIATYGGAGNETFGGLAALPDTGLYLAGTTNSPDLPNASTTFQGGPSDGFLAHLDPVTAVPLRSTYLGGSDADEITAMESFDGDLHLAGATASPNLALPGIQSEAAAGRTDGLFVHADSFAAPMRAARLGGPGEDRMLGITVLESGKVALAGATDSPEWLRSFDPAAEPGAALDAFTLNLAFNTIRVVLAATQGVPTPQPIGTLTIGRDLQAVVNLQATLEPGMDGLLLVRSSDPSKLLISESPDVPGRAAMLFRIGLQQSSIALQALAGEGDVEVTVEGRPTSSDAVPSIRRVLRVRLAPSRIFLRTSSAMVFSGRSFEATLFTAPLLPNGVPGPPQDVRVGIVFDPTFEIPAGSALSVLREPYTRSGSGVFSLRMVASATGSYAAIPTSSRFPAAPDQVLSVHSIVPEASPFPISNLQIPKDHVIALQIPGVDGDSLQVVSEDPANLRVGSARGMERDQVLIASGNGAFLYLTAFSDKGIAAIRIEGVFNRQPFSARVLLRMVPYTARFGGIARNIVSPGTRLSLTVETLPRWDASATPFSFGSSATLRPGAAAQLRSSNTAILEPVPNSTPGTFEFISRALGNAVLSFPPESPPEIAALTFPVSIVPPRISFGLSEFVLATGSSQFFSIAESTVDFGVIGTIRLRISDPALFALRTAFALEPAVNYPVGPSSLAIVATGARPGDKATLFVSGQGLPEFGIPVRAVAPLFVPNRAEMRVAAGESGGISFLNGGDDNGRPFTSFAIRNEKTTRLRVRAVPAGVCDFPESVEGQVELGLTFRCLNPGTVTLNLEPSGDISPLQSSLVVRISVVPPQPPPVFPVPRVLVGDRLQTTLSLSIPDRFSTRLFQGRLRSSDPARLLISTDPKARGSAQIDTGAGPRYEVYLQGYASGGVVQLIAETADGRSTSIPVFLFPSTIALRTRPSSSFFPGGFIQYREIEQPLGDPSFTVTARPYLVEPATGELIEENVAIRGGTDPFFLRRESSDAAIVTTLAPDAIFNEGESAKEFTFRAVAEGLATIRAIQPEGFVNVPDAGLRVRVFARKLTLTGAPQLLSADLQSRMQAAAVSVNSATPPSVSVTVTSLDPSKVLIATGPTQPGLPRATVASGQEVYIQALSSVTLGERVSVQLSAPNFVTSDVSFTIAPLGLRRESQSPVELSLFTPIQVIPFLYGPVEGDRIASGAYGLRPGVSLPVQLSSSDPSILEPVSVSAQPGAFLRVEVRPRRPGQALLRLVAPPSVLNQNESTPVTVRPWEFVPYESEPAARHLVSRFSFRNPSPGPVTATVSAANAAPLRFGTAQTGPNAPQASTLTVPLPPGLQRDLFVEPGTGANSGAIVISAPDFSNREISLSINEPGMSFDAPGPVLVNLTNRTFAVNLRLHIDGFGAARDLPLGGSFGPLRVTLQSSNPQVVRVPASVDFNPGDSRKSVTLELVGTGDAAVSLILPANFTRGTPRRDLLISVR